MDILENLTKTLEKAIEERMGGRTAIAFSGGLDSGVIAAMASKHGDVKLYTVGVMDSYDVRASEELAGNMGLEWEHIVITEDNIEECLMDMIRLTGTVNPITLSFELPLYYVMKHCSEDTILTGQGADEIFAGYAKYMSLSDDRLKDQMNMDMMELMNTTLVHEDKMAAHFEKIVGYPYLDERVMNIVENMDIEDLAPREVRKAVLRDVAHRIGQPDIAAKPKKAAQYGSGTMEMLRKIAKKRKTTVSGLVGMFSQ